jgi:hypothetical protein
MLPTNTTSTAVNLAAVSRISTIPDGNIRCCACEYLVAFGPSEDGNDDCKDEGEGCYDDEAGRLILNHE